MGNSYIYWYPDGAHAPRTVDLGRKLSDIQDVPEREVYDSSPLYGIQRRQDLGGRRRLRFIVERLQSPRDDNAIRHLRSLVTHLQAGNAISISLDHAKTWGTWVVPLALPEIGDTAIITGGNYFTALNSSGALASGDEVTLESANPRLQREYGVVSSTSGLTVTLQAGVLNDMSGSTSVFMRYADFYPALVLPEDQVNQPQLSHDRRLTWTWDVELVEYPGAIQALESTAQTLGYSGGPVEGPGASTLGSISDMIRDGTGLLGDDGRSITRLTYGGGRD